MIYKKIDLSQAMNDSKNGWQIDCPKQLNGSFYLFISILIGKL